MITIEQAKQLKKDAYLKNGDKYGLFQEVWYVDRGNGDEPSGVIVLTGEGNWDWRFWKFDDIEIVKRCHVLIPV